MGPCSPGGVILGNDLVEDRREVCVNAHVPAEVLELVLVRVDLNSKVVGSSET